MFKALLSVRLHALLAGLFRPKKGKGERSTAATVGIALLAAFVVLCLLFCLFMMAFSMGVLLLPTGNVWLYFGIFGALAFLLSVFGSFMTAKVQLFDSKDNDILLPMPIPPFLILLSRMVSLVLTAFLYVLAILLPAVIVYFLLMPLHAGVLFGFLFGMVSVTLLSVTVSSLFGYLFALASSFFKNKSLIAVLATLLFFLVYVFFYGFLFSMDTEDTEAMESFFLMLASAFRGTPIQFVGEVLIGNPWALIPALLVSGGLFAGLMALLSRGFFRVTAGGVSSGKRKKQRAEAFAAGHFRLALLKKDVKFLFNNATYLINAALGALLLLLLAGFLFVAGGGFYQSMVDELMLLGAEEGEAIPVELLLDMLVIPVLTLVLCVAAGSMITVTAASISTEAKTIWLLQSLPVRALDVLFSKVYLQLLIALPPLLLAVIAGAVAFGLPFYVAILMFLAVAAVSYLSAVFGLMMNLLLPKFDAISIGHAAKQSGSVVITIFAMMLLSMALTIPGFFLVPLVGPVVYLILMTVAALVLSVLPTLYIVLGGGKRFASFSV